MSDTLMRLDEFLVETFDFYYEIATAVNYANELHELPLLPIELKVETRNAAARCKFIFDKYDKFLRMDPTDEGFEQSAYAISKSLYEDIDLVYAFLNKLDTLFLNYGPGPAFSKKHFLVIGPPLKV